VAIVATLVAGCSSPDEASLAGGSSPAPASSTSTATPASPTSTSTSVSTTTARPTTKKAAAAGCLAVSAKMRKAIGTGLEDGFSLTQAAAVKSPDFAKVYFIAGRLKGPGVDQRAVWASNSLTPGGGVIMAVDAMAQEFSDWGDADSTDAQISKVDPSVRRARACLS
jgi:hypothetical protein